MKTTVFPPNGWANNLELTSQTLLVSFFSGKSPMSTVMFLAGLGAKRLLDAEVFRPFGEVASGAPMLRLNLRLAWSMFVDCSPVLFIVIARLDVNCDWLSDLQVIARTICMNDSRRFAERAKYMKGLATLSKLKTKIALVR